MMQRLRKLFLLSPRQQWVLARAVWTVAAVRLALLAVPFAHMRHYCGRPARRTTPPGHLPHAWPQDYVWSVQKAGSLIPGASCLTQAFALQLLLRNRGLNSSIRIGVAREGLQRVFAAHAWLERDGQILIGNRNNLKSFTPLADLNATAA